MSRFIFAVLVLASLMLGIYAFMITSEAADRLARTEKLSNEIIIMADRAEDEAARAEKIATDLAEAQKNLEKLQKELDKCKSGN